jgi:hypothetical protein
MSTKRKTSRIKIKITKSLESTEYSINSNNYIINDVVISDSPKTSERLILTSLTSPNNSQIIDNIYTQFPILFRNPNSIMIPTKVKVLIERKLPRKILDAIHDGEKTEENRAIAIELCFLFLYQLASTYRNIVNGTEPEGWKSLRAEYLRTLLWINEKTYQKVEDALLHSYDEGSILERGTYKSGKFSTKFRLGDVYRSKGYTPYTLQTNHVQLLHKKSCTRKLTLAHGNVICTNLLEFYKNIELPSKQDILDEATRLVASGKPNKKGKTLRFLNKKKKSYYQNLNSVTFVEDAIKVYEYLTNNGLIIPRAGNDRSGGRVVDSFTLMPSWIRKLVKINGEAMVECDYTCLHPNIAMSLYGGSSKFLTHQSISDITGIDCSVVKTQHLSFFNMRVNSMLKSALYDFYSRYESELLNKIINEKKSSEFEHKVTSRRLFKMEVAIMTTVITRLNELGIYVGYIYDALFFEPQHKEHVKKIMDEVIIEYNVMTSATVS